MRAPHSLHFDEEGVVELCHQARSAAPADCARDARLARVKPAHVVAMCAGAESTAPTECFKTVRSTRLGVEDRAALCRRAPTVAPAECANAAPFSLSAQHVATLCAGAASTQPSSCAAKIRSQRYVLRGATWYCCCR